MDLENLGGGVGGKAFGALEKGAPEARAEDCQKARCSLIFQFSEDRSQESDQGRVERDRAWAKVTGMGDAVNQTCFPSLPWMGNQKSCRAS